MLFSPSQELEDVLVETLGARPVDGATLLLSVRKVLPNTTKETFYRTLRKLLVLEVVIKNKRLYAISSRWLEKLSLWSTEQTEKSFFSKSNAFLSLEEGNWITYNFKNAQSMYNYWAYIYDMVYQKHNHKVPILLYHTHEWFIHGRKESEYLFLNRFKHDKQLAFLSIGSKSALDKEFQKSWSGQFLKINVGFNFSLENTEYINVVGDYIFKVSMSKRFADDLDDFFNIEKTISEENLDKLLKIVKRKEKAKLVFKHSKKEADIWRKKFRKYFVFPNGV